MRMKFNKSSQLMLVAAASLLTAGLMTACTSLTVDFVFVASSKAAGANNYGEINIFEINSESGAMRQIPASPVPSGGRQPVAEAVSADYASLFVANQDDNTIVQFVIGSDGKLYPFNTVNTPGVFPLALAANAANLFVVDTYQPLPTCSTAAPCAGSIAVFPLAAGGSSSNAPCTATVCIQPAATNSSISAQYWPLTLAGKNSNDVVVPTGVSVVSPTTSSTYVYITAYDSSVTPTIGYVFGFSVGSGGVLTPLTGSPFAAGVQPSAVAGDPSGKYLYVTDYSKGDVLAYAIASGLLTPLSGNPLPGRRSALRDRRRSQLHLQLRLRGQLPGLHRYGLLLFVEQRRAYPHRHLRDRSAARRHGNRSLHQPFPLHRQLSRQQRLRLRAECSRRHAARCPELSLCIQRAAHRRSRHPPQRRRLRRQVVGDGSITPYRPFTMIYGTTKYEFSGAGNR